MRRPDDPEVMDDPDTPEERAAPRAARQADEDRAQKFPGAEFRRLLNRLPHDDS